MRIQLTGLEQNAIYLVQLRSKYGISVSEWSRMFELTTDKDSVKPNPVTNLAGVMNEGNLSLSWTKPTTNEDGSALNDFKDFEVTVGPNPAEAPWPPKVYYTESNRLEFPREENISSFGTYRTALTVTVRVRDIVGNLSTPATQNIAKPRPKPVTGLTWAAVGDSFVGSWTPPTQNTDNSAYTDPNGYEVKVKFGTNPNDVRTYIVSSPAFGLSFAENQATFLGTARSPLTLEVRARDSVGQFSDITSAVGTNAAPAAPGQPTGVEQFGSIDIKWPAVTDADLKHYEVWQGTTVSDTGVLVATRTDSSYTHYVTSTTVDNFFYIKAVDKFGSTSTNSPRVGPLRPRSATTVDTVAPGDISLASLTVDPSLDAGGAPQFLIRWTPVTDTDNDLAGYKVRYATADTQSRAWVYAADVAPDDIVNSKVETLINSGLHSGDSGNGQLYEVQVRPYDYTANYGSWVGKTATTPASAVTSSDVAEPTTILPGGYIQSSDYVDGTSGFKLSHNGLDIEGGTIAARALQIQEGSNLVPAEFAGFEFVPEYYSATAMNRTATGVSTPASGAKFQSQFLQFNGDGVVYLGAGNTSAAANIPVDPSSTYILSWWAKVVSGTPALAVSVLGATPVARTSADLGFGQALTSAWVRHSMRFTTSGSDTAVLISLTGSGGGAIGVDGVQVEQMLTGSTKPSQWKPPGLTRIDGGIIRTGEIRSTTMSPVGDTSQPAWSLNTQGNMQINDGIVRGRLIVGAVGSANTSISIASHNYGAATGSQWAILGDGSFKIRAFGTSGTTQYLDIDANGLRANNGTRETFSISATTGSAKFASANGGLLIDDTGLTLYSGVTPMVTLTSATGSAVFNGTIGATGGSIGGWTINASTGLSSGSLFLRPDLNGVYAGSGTSTVGMRGGFGFWAGTSEYSTGAPFAVSTSGYLYSTQGLIGGFTMSSTEGFYSGSGTTRVQMKPGTGFWAGSTSPSTSSPFWVNADGSMYSSKGTVEGTVRATIFRSMGATTGGNGSYIQIGAVGAGDPVDEIRMLVGYGSPSTIRNPSTEPGAIAFSTSSGQTYIMGASGGFRTNGASIYTNGGLIEMNGSDLRGVNGIRAGQNSNTYIGMTSTGIDFQTAGNTAYQLHYNESGDGNNHGVLRYGSAGSSLKWLIGGNLQVRNFDDNAYAAIAASAFTVNSTQDFKTDIRPYEDGALAKISAAPVKRWKLQKEVRKDGTVIYSEEDSVGPILEQMPNEVYAENSTEMYDITSVIGLLWKGVQELDQRTRPAPVKAPGRKKKAS